MADRNIGETEYSYSHLNQPAAQIRLLTLAPHERHDADIHCTIQTISMYQDPKHDYEALSYAWGDPNDKTTIYLNGTSINVTSNLCIALRHLRQILTPRTLWVDAICIDQNNIAERNHQVQMMRHIYSRASLVLIWLGKPDKKVEKTFTIILHKDHDNRRIDKMYEMEFQGLVQMLKLAWWHRIWVIQEALVATPDPLVGCGPSWLRWSKLTRELRFFAQVLRKDKERLISLTSKDHAWEADPPAIDEFVNWKDKSAPGLTNEDRPETFSEVITKTRSRGATDPRDQIYAILGLVRDEDQAILPIPDYGKPVSEVYQEAMAAIFKCDGSLNFLKHAPNEPHEQRRDLPSWCVDFSKITWDSYAFGRAVSEKETIELKGYVNAFTHDPHLGTLRVAGRFLGNVNQTDLLAEKPLSPWKSEVASNFSSQRKISADRGRVMTSLADFLQRVLAFTCDAGKAFESRFGRQAALKRIATGEIWKIINRLGSVGSASRMTDLKLNLAFVSDKEDSPRLDPFVLIERSVRELIPSYADGLRRSGLYYPLPHLPKITRADKIMFDFLLMWTFSSRGCSWLVTKNGYVARVGGEVRKDDVLCRISGCEDLCILRPGDGETFELVCMCRSPDFQEADFLQWMNEAEEREFVLR